jgi:hypothetical protein
MLPMQGGCEYTEQVVANSRQRVVIKLTNWAGANDSSS